MCGFSRPMYIRPVFGVALADAHRSVEFQFVPKIVVKCIAVIERKENIRSIGIYNNMRASESRLAALRQQV